MSSASLPEAARKNIRTVRELEAQVASRRTRADRITASITGFVGSFQFLVAQTVVFLVWVGANLAPERSRPAFDPFPFGFLAVLLALEAIVLSAFVLMAQNRQSREAEQREHVHLQVALLAEQESTKMLQLLHAICERLGMEQATDPEVAELIEATRIEELASEVEKMRGAEGERPKTDTPTN